MTASQDHLSSLLSTLIVGLILECILLVFYVISLIYLFAKAKVITLCKHYSTLDTVRLKRNGVIVTRRPEDESPDKFLTISELSKQNMRKKQIELDNVIALKLQAKEKKQFKIE